MGVLDLEIDSVRIARA